MPHPPNMIQGFLNFVNQRKRGVKQAGDADGAKGPDLEIVDKLDDASGDFFPFLPQWFEGLVQHGFDLLMHAERLENRKT